MLEQIWQNKRIKTKIEQVINAFETGRREGIYDAVARLYDGGPNRIRQITYGRSQTSEHGNLRKLLEMYMQIGGVYAAKFAPFLPYIAKVSPNDPKATILCGQQEFIDLLKKAAKSDELMRKAQDDFFDKNYYLPAVDWWIAEGFTLPFSLLVIYDSFIHSGGILKFLRNDFPEPTPKKGGKEKQWITSYVIARDNWLEHNKDADLRATDYRTDAFLQEIKDGNWDLSGAIIANGILIN